jgi:hypothetical protein
MTSHADDPGFTPKVDIYGFANPKGREIAQLT